MQIKKYVYLYTSYRRLVNTCISFEKMNEQLENLMFQSDRKADFSPRAHLCILTDTLQVTGPLHLMITDLVHTCLSNYFLPHRDAASVSWVKR
jgi:hypothetical protein